jgi:hypothetical protein
MAIVTRVNGDAAGVVNVDAGRSLANAAIINTGIAAPLSAYKITGMGGNLAAELAVGGAIETVLRTLSINSTILAYQVDANSQLSVLVERTGWVNDAAVQTAVRALGANIGAVSTVDASSATVSSAGGLKLA